MHTYIHLHHACDTRSEAVPSQLCVCLSALMSATHLCACVRYTFHAVHTSTVLSLWVDPLHALRRLILYLVHQRGDGIPLQTVSGLEQVKGLYVCGEGEGEGEGTDGQAASACECECRSSTRW